MVFTLREKEIIKYIILGYEYIEIAKKLQITLSTVKLHMSNIRKKSNTHNSQQVTLIYLKKYYNIDIEKILGES